MYFQKLNMKKNISQDIKYWEVYYQNCLKFYTANVKNMGYHTVSTENVMSMYWNVCLMMVTRNRNM